MKRQRPVVRFPHKFFGFFRFFPLSIGLLTVLLLCGMDVGLARAAETMPIEEYWRRVDDLSRLLEGDQVDGEAVATAADQLAAIKAVTLPSGQIVPVDNDELMAILRSDDLEQKDVAYVRSRFKALAHAKDGLSSLEGPASNTDQAFARLDEILSRSEFDQTQERPERRSLWDEILDRLGRTLARWLARAGDVPGIEYLLTLVGVGVVLAVVWFAFRNVWLQWAVERRAGGNGGTDGDAGLSSVEALERAQVQVNQGDYRQAVRYLYLSTLLWLDERRLIRYDPALTNREVLDRIARGEGQGGLYAALVPVVDVFDRVWYGFVPLDDRGFATYSRQVERIRRVAGAE